MFAEVTEKQVESWKEKYEEGVLIWDTPNGKLYLRNPNKSDKFFHTIKRALVFQRRDDLVSAGEIIFNQCYLGGLGELKEINKNDPVYISVCLACTELIELVEGVFTVA